MVKRKRGHHLEVPEISPRERTSRALIDAEHSFTEFNIDREVILINSPRRIQGHSASTSKSMAGNSSPSTSPVRKRVETSDKVMPDTDPQSTSIVFSQPDVLVKFFVKVSPDDKPKEFHMHKEVACKASPVLNAAFNSQFAEGLTRTYHLEKVDPAAFGLLMQWAYAGKAVVASIENAGKLSAWEDIFPSFDMPEMEQHELKIKNLSRELPEKSEGEIRGTLAVTRGNVGLAYWYITGKTLGLDSAILARLQSMTAHDTPDINKSFEATESFRSQAAVYNKELACLAELWILADRLLMPRLQNYSISCFDKVLRHSNGYIKDFGLVTRIYENTSEDSALRHYILHMILSRISVKQIKSKPDMFTYEMLIEVLALREKRNGLYNSPSSFNMKDFEVAVEVED